jgi:spermidine synthase
MADAPIGHDGAPSHDLAPGVLTEELTDAWGFYIRSARELERSRSAFQAIEVHDTVPFGKLFRLDGHFMTSEHDEFFYHENLVHLAAVSHPLPQRALVIGGGDGGSAEEIFKHPSIRSVRLAEIDATVVAIARRYFASIHAGALDDPRLELEITDGFAYVQSISERFDLIVVDLTDPGGPSERLYTREFYEACAARLEPGGALTLHIASPIAHPDRIRATLAHLRAAFAVVTPYLTSVPLYGGMWMMACASDALDPRALSVEEVDRRIGERHLHRLNYYNGETHRAALALPNFVRELVR